MPIPREQIVADNSSYDLFENEDQRLISNLKEVNEPRTDTWWKNRIREFKNCSTNKSVKTFNRLVKQDILIFLRIYRGDPIYVMSSTPIWFHDKMPTE